MNVQEMIDVLESINDKALPVCIDDWNVQYESPAVAKSVQLCDAEYLHCGLSRMAGKYVCIGIDDA